MRSTRIIDTLHAMEYRLVRKLERVPGLGGLNQAKLIRDARALFARLHATLGRDLYVKTPAELTSSEQAHVKTCLVGYRRTLARYFYAFNSVLDPNDSRENNLFADFRNDLTKLAKAVIDYQEPERKEKKSSTSSATGSVGLNDDDLFNILMRNQGFFNGIEDDPNYFNAAMSDDYCVGYLEGELLNGAARAIHDLINVTPSEAHAAIHAASSAAHAAVKGAEALGHVVIKIADGAQPLLHAAGNGAGDIAHAVGHAASGCCSGDCCGNCGECCGGCCEATFGICATGGVGGTMGAGAKQPQPSPPPPPPANPTVAATTAGAATSSGGVQMQGTILTPLRDALAIGYGIIFVPYLIGQAYNSISNICRGYRVGNHGGKLCGLLTGLGGGFALGYVLPGGGPHTGAAASLVASWGFRRIVGCALNGGNRETFDGEANPEKYRLPSTAIASLRNAITTDGNQATELNITDGMQKLEDAIKAEKKQESLAKQSCCRWSLYKLWKVPYVKSERHQHLYNALKELQKSPEPDINTVKDELKKANLEFNDLFARKTQAHKKSA